jgi:hypothetical protein
LSRGGFEDLFNLVGGYTILCAASVWGICTM